jgi:hypothetical protein
MSASEAPANSTSSSSSQYAATLQHARDGTGLFMTTSGLLPALLLELQQLKQQWMAVHTQLVAHTVMLVGG